MAKKEHTFQEPATGTYIAVWLFLLLLTATTVAVARLQITEFVILIPIGIATLKSGIVVMHFMHLKDEPWIVKIMLFVALLALALIIMLTFTDVSYREGGNAHT